LGSNPGSRGGKPATNPLHCGKTEVYARIAEDTPNLTNIRKLLHTILSNIGNGMGQAAGKQNYKKSDSFGSMTKH
jgi:hypothetical protein